MITFRSNKRMSGYQECIMIQIYSEDSVDTLRDLGEAIVATNHDLEYS